VRDEIARRSGLAWLAIVARVCAVALACIALLAEGRSQTWVLLACAAGLAVAPVAWRQKAALVPGAMFSTSADYLPEGRPGQVPGELSVTASALTWNPSRHSVAQGCLPLTVGIDDCTAITMKAGPALLDVFITVQRRNGGEWLFLTHRRPGLGRALTRLNDLIAR
jgi:hypothetical protein